MCLNIVDAVVGHPCIRRHWLGGARDMWVWTLSRVSMVHPLRKKSPMQRHMPCVHLGDPIEPTQQSSGEVARSLHGVGVQGRYQLGKPWGVALGAPRSRSSFCSKPSHSSE